MEKSTTTVTDAKVVYRFTTRWTIRHKNDIRKLRELKE